MAFWPLGFAILAFTYGAEEWDAGITAATARPLAAQDGAHAGQDGLDARQNGGGGGPWGRVPSSGNRAFDEYRTETLRRLEEEQREFRDFLERLRFAKDKTEFDAFMAERRNSPPQENPRPAQN